MDARLEIRRANTEPKCANCRWWEENAYPFTGKCSQHKITTLDLAVCAAWESAEVSQQVLPPEQDE